MTIELYPTVSNNRYVAIKEEDHFLTLKCEKVVDSNFEPDEPWMNLG